MPKITFLPDGITIDVKPGTTVFRAAARAEVAIPSQCGGKCACALCRVKVVDGEGLASPMRWDEECHMGNAFFLTRERLSCQLQVFGDMTVEVEEAPVKEKKRGRYIPHALVRKREAQEKEAELARVRGEARPAGKGRRDKDGRRPNKRARPNTDARPKDPRPKDARPKDPRPQVARPKDHRPKDARPNNEARPKQRPPGGGQPADGPAPNPDVRQPQPGEEAREARSEGRRRRRRRRRGRNPGAPRSGDSRPPAGAVKDKS